MPVVNNRLIKFDEYKILLGVTLCHSSFAVTRGGPPPSSPPPLATPLIVVDDDADAVRWCNVAVVGTFAGEPAAPSPIRLQCHSTEDKQH